MGKLNILILVAGCSYLALISALGLVLIFVRTVRYAGWDQIACKINKINKVRPGSGIAFIGGGFPVGKNALVINTTYSYAVNGSDYSGHRVGIFDSDNLLGVPLSSNYDRKLYEKLESALHTQETVRGWASPSNPKNAILDRQFYFRKLFFMIIILTLSSAGLIYFGNLL